ncbi:TBC1 domain family member 22B isoform X3 [Octopus sinensis]|uniref:TBC1 domain family member 22B isoform X3 n=1 Tax=Octopus sinensis TaxID=2607531 RepID=A0A6P7TJW9_9MOLL|nr:TBC1 domain family member 22B isoform X3 [Octopus sinensis]
MSTCGPSALPTSAAANDNNDNNNGNHPVFHSASAASPKATTTTNYNKQGFWKKSTITPVPGSIKPVYGAQHPPRIERPISNPGTPKKDDKLKNKTKDSFRDFENETSDAWDDGDDDLILMATVQMSLKDVQSTARAVLDNHSKQFQALNGTSQGSPVKSPSGCHMTAIPSAISLGAGPGVGVRLNSHWQPPRITPLRFGQPSVPDRESAKLEKFHTLLTSLTSSNAGLEKLRKLSWSGIPKSVRPTAWKILSGYLPVDCDRRQPTLERKRKEYFSFVEQYYGTRHQVEHQDTFRQIHIDIPRMNPLVPLFQLKVVQEIFERILYIWAIRHPASGYVQGINDLVTPFFVVYLSEYISNDIEVENCDLSKLSIDTLNIIEADSFWCTTRLLDGIQDNYTFAQPGIQMKVNALKELVKRIDVPLYKHLEKHNVEFLQFAFRWMNNLLMREIPLRCTIRLWDTYQAEINGFANFHLYLCAAFLTRFSIDIQREKDFQGILMFLQNLPTHHWQNEEIGELLAEAFKLKYMFADAPNHLVQKS